MALRYKNRRINWGFAHVQKNYMKKNAKKIKVEKV